MEIDKANIPKHIAIIMDGNGRWAKKRFMPRVMGHKAGVKSVDRTLKAAAKLGVSYLTLYAFSTENWKRPQEEINALMQLLVEALDKNLPKFMENNVVLKVIGASDSFPKKIVEKLNNTISQTAANGGITLVLALNYSGTWEITEATKRIVERVQNREISISDISIETLDKEMATNFMSPPDLIIRTSGEKRLSNFLLWQSAYSELYFTDELWPDFDEKSLEKAIVEYQSRERRYGAIK